MNTAELLKNQTAIRIQWRKIHLVEALANYNNNNNHHHYHHHHCYVIIIVIVIMVSRHHHFKCQQQY